jgi:hypothetical protein
MSLTTKNLQLPFISKAKCAISFSQVIGVIAGYEFVLPKVLIITTNKLNHTSALHGFVIEAQQGS